MPTALPAQPTMFVGRMQELSEIEALLANPGCRLLTLVGPGGVGKTRLALAAAERFISPPPNRSPSQVGADEGNVSFPDGVHFVALQPLGSPSLLVSVIADAVRLSFYGQDDPQTQLFNFLSRKRLLLVLDNFEHLLDGVGLVSELLVNAPGVKALATSREVLSLQEEWLYTVHGMVFPQSAYSQSAESYEAVQFFLHTARRFQPDLSLDTQQADVIQVCRLAEGMPLALEMAASWLQALTCKQVASEMQRSMDFLAVHTRNVPERHRSMRAVFNHSWNLLAEVEREVFAKLSVFRGGFEREAAEPVAGATLPVLAALVEKSLVRKLSSGRYDIHELLRQFAQEQLEAYGAGATAHDAHSQYYADFMREREIDLKGRRQIEALSDIEADLENIRAAWDWALQTQRHDIIHQTMEALFWFGLIRSRQHDVNALFNDAVARVRGNHSDFVQARIITRQCYLLPYETAPHIPIKRLEDSLATLEQYGEQAETAICTVLLALFLGGIEQRDFQRAFICAHNSLTYFQAVADRYYLAHSLHAFAWTHYYMGEREKAMQYAHQCAQLRREIGDHYGIARILLLVAAEAYSIPDYDKAERFNREVRDIWRELKSWNYVAFVDGNLAYLAIFRGEFEAAKALLNESLDLARAVNLGDHIAYALALSGVLASLEERYVEARQLLSEAEQLATFTSSVEALEWGLPLAACGLGDYETARSANGRAFQFSRRLNAPGRYLWHLPAACVILANDLVIGVGTAKTHTLSIYRKLDVNSRTQAVARAHELRLIPHL